MGLFAVADVLSPLLDDSKELGSPRNFVLSQDTFVCLELNFSPGPGRSLIFDSLEVPFTHSIKYAVDRRGRRTLSLHILLVDAATDMFARVGERYQGKVDDQSLALSLVDFQADHNIIDLRDGKCIVHFTLPCCILDSTHRTGQYR